MSNAIVCAHAYHGRSTQPSITRFVCFSTKISWMTLFAVFKSYTYQKTAPISFASSRYQAHALLTWWDSDTQRAWKLAREDLAHLWSAAIKERLNNHLSRVMTESCYRPRTVAFSSSIRMATFAMKIYPVWRMESMRSFDSHPWVVNTASSSCSGAPKRIINQKASTRYCRVIDKNSKKWWRITLKTGSCSSSKIR